MKRSTGFLVITIFVVALGCSGALAQGVTLGFEDATQSYLYCEYEDFGAGSPLAAGIEHVALDLCPGEADGTMIGVLANLPNSSGLPVTGPVYMLATSLQDAANGYNTGLQIITFTKTKASKNHFGWENLLNDYDDNMTYLYLWGYLSNQTPSQPFISGNIPLSSHSLALKTKP